MRVGTFGKGDLIEPEDADLHIEQQAFKEIDKSVQQYIKQNT
jgi:hypothetical protein